MMNVGPFHVLPDGRLQPRESTARPVVRYGWRGRSCAAELTEDALRLVSVVGRIPSTADRGRNRAATVKALVALRHRMPAGVELRVLPDHRVVLRRQARRPDGAIELVSEMTRFALAMDPALEELAAVGA